jgi:DNA-binding LytR/AlgR family response regulator
MAREGGIFMLRSGNDSLPGDIKNTPNNRIWGSKRAFQIVVCDGREKDRMLLCQELKRFFWDRGEGAHFTEYNNGKTLLADIEEEYIFPEMIFLEIYMNGMNGMELAHRLRRLGYKGHIIFVTVSSDYAVESYEVHASGYLLKPLHRLKFIRMMEHLLPVVQKNHVVVQHGRNRQELVDVATITYAESSAHILAIHLSDGNVLETREKLDIFEEVLDDPRFLRCHQSFLVNMDYIADVQKDFLLQGGELVPIRVRSRKQVVDCYLQYFKTKREIDDSLSVGEKTSPGGGAAV